jgi:hypothetical protein
MAHYAKIDENNIVTEVIVIGNDITDPESSGTDTEQLGKDFIKDTLHKDGEWIQCSYNNNIRNKFPAIGDTYDASEDIFKPAKPYASWVWDAEEGDWEAPLAYPLDGLVDSDYPTGYPEDFVAKCEAEKDEVFYYQWREDEYQADNTKGWFLVKQNDWGSS